MPLNPLNHHYAVENPASVYDEEAMTALELAGRTTAKVNETVRAFNELETDTRQHLENQDQEISQRLQAQDEAIPVKVNAEMQRRIDNGDFDRSIDAYAGNLEARVDNLLGTVKEGSTTMDAEVIDGRVTVDGTTCSNIGDAIRAQVNELRNRIGAIHLEWESGFINANGQERAHTGFSRTGFTPVMGGAKYYLTSAYAESATTAFYDSAKQFISSVARDDYNLVTTLIEAPENAYYIRVSCETAKVDSAELRVENIVGQVQNNMLAHREISTIEIAPLEVKNGCYINMYGNYRSFASGSCRVYDVGSFVGMTLITNAYTADEAYHVFLNSGTVVGVSQSTVLVVPENADTLVITNLGDYSPHDSVYLKGDTQIVNGDMQKNINNLRKGAQAFVYGVDRVLCIGDSLTSGAYYGENGSFNGKSIDQNYPRYLSRMLRTDVTNAGVSGYSASDWYLNKLNTYDYTKFDTVIIWLGTNNGLTDTLADDVEAHSNYSNFANTETGYYCKIIETILAQNPDMFFVLCNVFASKGDEATTNKVIDEIAERYSAIVVDMTTMDTATHPEYHAGVDNPHFGKAGNIAIAHRIMDTINNAFGSNPLLLEYGLSSRTN